MTVSETRDRANRADTRTEPDRLHETAGPRFPRHRPELTQAGEPGWVISLTKWGAESSGKWWYAGDAAGSRRLASTSQRAFRFGTQTAAESVAQSFRDNGDHEVEVLRVSH